MQSAECKMQNEESSVKNSCGFCATHWLKTLAMPMRTILVKFIICIVLPFAAQPQAFANIDALHLDLRTADFTISQRAQQQLLQTNGFLVTEMGIAYLFTDQLEVGLHLTFLNNYGLITLYNVATAGTVNGPNSPGFSTSGFGRPIVRGRQLIYGNWTHGRWYVIEFGSGFFNMSGFVTEYFRYWSGRLALHEEVPRSLADTYLEIGSDVRSVSQFRSSDNTGIVYPPTVDVTAGIRRVIGRTHLATDLKFEQALAEIKVGGSYINGVNPPLGASTRAVWAMELGYRWTDAESLILRGAERLYRWPNDDGAALWATFDEGYLGSSLELRYRVEW